MHDILVIDSPGGALRLRRETTADDAFLKGLFAANREPGYRAAGLPQDQIAVLIDMQHRSRSQSYRSDFPGGRFWIVERDGALIMRDDERMKLKANETVQKGIVKKFKAQMRSVLATRGSA